MFNEIYTGNFEVNEQEIWEDRLDRLNDTFEKYEDKDDLMVEIIRESIADRMTPDHIVVVEEVEAELLRNFEQWGDDIAAVMEVIDDLRGTKF